MKQCPVCLRYYQDSLTKCAFCLVDLPSQQFSSEDADAGSFQVESNPDAHYLYQCPYCSFSFESDLSDSMNCWHCDHVMKQIPRTKHDQTKGGE